MVKVEVQRLRNESNILSSTQDRPDNVTKHWTGGYRAM